MADHKFEFTGLTPNLPYRDAGAMIDWLVRAFGFEERARYLDKDGVVRQAELYVGANELFISQGAPRGSEWICVWVDDVDAHYRRALAAGIEGAAPADQGWGVRSWWVKDPEGYGWTFLKRLERGYVQQKSLEDGGWREIMARGARR